MQNKMRQKANELLSAGAVKVVIGYGEGTSGNVRAIFIQKPEEVDQLIFDNRCAQNLAVYLTKAEVKALGKPAIVAQLSVLRSIRQLAYEKQIKEGDVEMIGIAPDGAMIDVKDLSSLTAYLDKNPMTLSPDEREMLEKFNRMTREERWKFWLETMSGCIKCYACRASCPLCYCARCTVECNQPQWISVPSHEIGNMEWHIMRAMHLAARCVNCGDCFRACPLKIPLNLLTKRIIADSFGEDDVYALATFKPDDKEDFIR